jgi:hypothetical protein
VTKNLEQVVFDPDKCRVEIAAFKKLLQAKARLEEREILTFFKKRKQLAAFIGTFAPNLGPATLLG